MRNVLKFIIGIMSLCILLSGCRPSSPVHMPSQMLGNGHVGSDKKANMIEAGKNEFTFYDTKGGVVVYDLLHPRPLTEIRKFLDMVKLPLITDIIQADPDGGVENSILVGDNTITLTSQSEALENDTGIALLNGEAYALKLKAHMTDYRAHDIGERHKTALLAEIDQDYVAAIHSMRSAEDNPGLISTYQKYGSFEEDLGNHDLADNCYQLAAYEVKRFDVPEAKRYILLITFNTASKEKVRRATVPLMHLVRAEAGFSQAEHLRGIIFRLVDAHSTNQNEVNHLWSEMMQAISSSIAAYDALHEHKQLAHALEWRAVMNLYQEHATPAELARASADAHRAIIELSLARTEAIEKTGGQKPFHIAWEEEAACGSAEMQALIRFSLLKGSEPRSKKRDRLSDIRNIGKDLLVGSPPDASALALARIANAYATATMLLVQNSAKPRSHALVKEAALCFAVGDVLDSKASDGLVYIARTRILIPSKYIQESKLDLAGRSKDNIRSFIADANGLFSNNVIGLSMR